MVDDALLGDARARTRELGKVPGRNYLMREFKIGAKRANELISILNEDEGFVPGRVPGYESSVQGESLYSYPLGTDSLSPDTFPETSDVPGDVSGNDLVDLDTCLDSPPVSGYQTAPEIPYPGMSPGTAAVPDARTRVSLDAYPGTGSVPAERAHSEAFVLAGHEPFTARIAPGTDPVPGYASSDTRVRPKTAVWPILVLTLPALAAIWSGWVGLGTMTGFGVITPFPGIWDSFELNTAITLPIGMETYAAYALYVWFSSHEIERARKFARASAIGSLVFGAAGQIAYHLLSEYGIVSAPWWLIALVSCVPVAVLGMGAALAHMVRAGNDEG